MGSEVEAEITRLRGELGAETDAELASLLGVRRSAVSQWRKRGRVPDKASREVSKIKANRAAVRRADADIRAMLPSHREFASALAASFVVRYSRGDPQRLLRWASQFDEVVLAAARLLQTRCSINSEPLAHCYEHLLTRDRFFEQDLVEELVRGGWNMGNDRPDLPQ